jgi:hypothetical protein
LAQVLGVKPSDPPLNESFVPARDKAAAALDSFGHLIPRMAFGQQQDQPRSSGIFRPIRSAVRSPCQFNSLRIRQLKISGSNSYVGFPPAIGGETTLDTFVLFSRSPIVLPHALNGEILPN